MPLPITDLVQFIVEAFDRSDSIPAPRLETTRQIGAYGEKVAAAYLRRKHGYRVLDKNYRTPRGEIDLICRDGQVLVFVEVRARASHDYGTSVETINSAKQARLRFAAERYLQELGRTDIFVRFDAVGILLTSEQVPVCTLYRDLFQLNW